MPFVLNLRHDLNLILMAKQFVGVVARVESLRGRMGESETQVERLFESLLAQSFDGGR